jgi:hypothetical protein
MGSADPDIKGLSNRIHFSYQVLEVWEDAQND